MSRFNLPVLGRVTRPLTPADLIARTLHGNAIYNAALGETINLDLGTAIVSPDLPEVDMANEMRDIQPPQGVSIADALAEAQRTFAEKNTRCLAWSFAGGHVDETLAAAIEKLGYERHTSEVWALAHPNTAGARSDLTLIPARASYAKIQELFLLTGVAQGEAPARANQYTLAATRCLDDQRVDAILALDGQTPVGIAYLVTAGESGFIADFYVHPARKREKIGTTLMDRIIELATRSRHRSLTLFCRPGNTAARALYTATGWEVIAQIQSLRWPLHAPQY